MPPTPATPVPAEISVTPDPEDLPYPVAPAPMKRKASHSLSPADQVTYRLQPPEADPFSATSQSLAVPEIRHHTTRLVTTDLPLPSPDRPSSADQETPQNFACPYAKQNPKRYSQINVHEAKYSGCGQRTLTDIARLKQHLYRVHQRPPHHCATCWTVFPSEDECARHVTLQSCPAKDCPFEEKMTAKQLSAIKKKNRGADPVVCWYDIYKTLFPDGDSPSSPYATNPSLDLFMQCVQEQAPRRLAQQLRTMHFLDDAVLEDLEASLITIVGELRRTFDQSMQTQDNSQHEDEESSRGNKRRKLATDALQVPFFGTRVRTPSLTSHGEVSAPGSNSPLLADTNDRYGGLPMASPSQGFAMWPPCDNAQNILPDQISEPGLSALPWPHRHQQQPGDPATFMVQGDQGATSPQPLYHPESGDWQISIPDGTHLAMEAPQPDFTTPPTWPFLGPDGRPGW